MAHTLETRRFKDTATARLQRANPRRDRRGHECKGKRSSEVGTAPIFGQSHPPRPGNSMKRMVMPEQGGSSERRPFPST